jgi:hypothetical protein
LRFSVNTQKNKDALMVHTLAHCKESKVMRVGAPKKIKTHECRVGLAPAAVWEHVAAGPFASYRRVRLPFVGRISMDSSAVDLFHRIRLPQAPWWTSSMTRKLSVMSLAMLVRSATKF